MLFFLCPASAFLPSFILSAFGADRVPNIVPVSFFQIVLCSALFFPPHTSSFIHISLLRVLFAFLIIFSYLFKYFLILTKQKQKADVFSKQAKIRVLSVISMEDSS